MNPYKDIDTATNKTVRLFTQDVDSHELVWHRDREDRIVRVLEGSGWKFQLDNNLPIQLNEGDVIHIPKYEYHRIIKGDTDLKVELYKIVDNLLEESSNRLKLNIPKNVKDIHNAFKRENKKLYVVGGAVRDAILGKTPKDFDLATDAKPDEVLNIAKKYGFNTVEVGKAFGVVIVNGEEIATFRKDIGAGRRPTAVDYTDIEGDVRRRDLTINALFYDIDRGEIVDLVGGIADLQSNKIRTVGKAVERFEEDPLRKLRALRFQARLGGTLDRDVYNALKKNPNLSGVSFERIRDEFIKSIKSAKSTKKYLQTLDELKFIPLIFPGLVVSKDYINESDYILLIAYLLRSNQLKNLHKRLNTLSYTNDEIKNILFLVSLQKFNPNDILLFKKQQEVTSLSDSQILKFGKLLGLNLYKFVNFKLSVRGSDVPDGITGKDMGDWIKNKESELFLSENTLDGISSFKELFERLPKELQTRVYALKNIGQNPQWHPEGNVLKHTIMVVRRALKDNDMDLAIAAMFHDIGKDETAGVHPKTGRITHYGHEDVSAKLAKKYRDWIIKMGGNPANVYYIVKNHMKFKQLSNMRPVKQAKLKSFRAFDKLSKFGKHDRGGLDEAKFAVHGNKVEKFITGKNLTLKGKKYSEIEFEVISVDNNSKLVTLRVLAPKPVFGMELPVKFSTLRRGPFFKTDTGAQFEVRDIDENILSEGIKVIDGHLTAKDKRVVLQIIKNGPNPAKAGKAVYEIKPDGDFYIVIKKQMDRGLIPVPGSKLRLSTYKSTIQIKESLVKEMAKSDVQKVDQFADKILNPVDVDLTSKHFFDRLNDPRNEKDINQAELIGFFKRLSRSKKKFIEFLDTYKQVVATDDRTNINIPFMKRANRAIAKTIMRKKNFATPNKRITI